MESLRGYTMSQHFACFKIQQDPIVIIMLQKYFIQIHGGDRRDTGPTALLSFSAEEGIEKWPICEALRANMTSSEQNPRGRGKRGTRADVRISRLFPPLIIWRSEGPFRRSSHLRLIMILGSPTRSSISS